jgi:quinone-modifying oxidoreductase subunit QmoC
LLIGLLVPFAIIYLIRSLAALETIPAGPVNYSKFFPHAILNSTFGILVLLAVMGVVMSIRSYMKAVKNDPVFGNRKVSWSSFFSGFKEILSHKRFRSCQEFKLGYYAHFLIFWGFVLLLFVTIFAIISVLFFEYPIPLWNPIKIVGNLASIMLFIGLTSLIIIRIVSRKRTNSTYFDWVFLISFYLLVISGILLEIFRFADLKSGYYIYYFHLVMVWFIIIYAPYTKFAHVIYRSLSYALI